MLNIFIKFAYFNTTLLLTKPNMSKIKSLDELRQMKARLESEMDIREKSNNPDNLVQIRVAMATCGIAAGARTVMNAIIDRVEREKLPVIVTQGGCMGYCYAEPTIEVKRPGEDSVVSAMSIPTRPWRYLTSMCFTASLSTVSFRSIIKQFRIKYSLSCRTTR